MSGLRLTWAALRAQPLAHGLAVLLLALGVAVIVVVLLLRAQLEARMVGDTRGIDLVVGAKGSPLQLVLSAVYQVDVPAGNISLAEARRLARHPLVESSVPMALGDAVAGFRIVGTTHEYVGWYGGRVEEGRLWRQPFEAVIGDEVARRTRFALGDAFVAHHGVHGEGEAHEDRPHRVVGILAPTGTVLDRLVLTGVESVWAVHEPVPGGALDSGAEPVAAPREEITALLVRYRSPMAAVVLPRHVNAETPFQAASPAYETARLLRLVGVGVDLVRAFALLMILAAGLTLFVVLYGALEARAADLAVMRALGATRGRVLWHVLSQGLALGSAGTVLGLGLGHAASEALGIWLRHSQQLAFTGSHWLASELAVVGLVLAIAVLAALPAALRAYRLDIAGVLAREA